MRVIIILHGKTWILWAGLLLATAILGVNISLLTSVWKTQSSLQELRVLVDPGHGGVDGGTCDSQGNPEKQINLNIALRIREHLHQSGLHVILTREKDMDLAPFSFFKRGRHLRDLMARIRKARGNRCLFLVSIHCDWSKDQQQSGAKVFYNHQSPVGRRLAEVIQSELNIFQQMNRKVAQGEFYMLKQRGVAGVIIEAGMLSNRYEALKLQNPNYQEQLALVIAKGVLKFCRQYLPTDPQAFNNLYYLEKLE